MNDFLAAESAIQQLHARYIDAVWRKDADAFADCFAKDAEWKIAGMHMRGRTEIGSPVRETTVFLRAGSHDPEHADTVD